jgi:hypothetical protein
MKLPQQHYPIIDAHGFLERAFLWLDSEIDVGIFYAALDLRFTFEKILINMVLRLQIIRSSSKRIIGNLENFSSR